MLLYHGSPHLFDHFELTGAGKGTGIKYGHGVYLTESEASAVHYSQPRHAELSPKHYLYTVEIPDLTDDNHLISAKPVTDSIIHRVEARLGTTVPEEAKNAGKKLRKWIGTMLTGAKIKEMTSPLTKTGITLIKMMIRLIIVIMTESHRRSHALHLRLFYQQVKRNV